MAYIQGIILAALSILLGLICLFIGLFTFFNYKRGWNDGSSYAKKHGSKTSIDISGLQVEIDKLALGPNDILLVRFPLRDRPQDNRRIVEALQAQLSKLALETRVIPYSIVASDDITFSVIENNQQVDKGDGQQGLPHEGW